jgi:hypothetical protein
MFMDEALTMKKNLGVTLTADPRQSRANSDPEAAVVKIHGAHR